MVQFHWSHVSTHKKDKQSGGCVTTALFLLGILVGILLVATQMKG